MDQGPLVTEQIVAGARLAAEFAERTPLRAAFWLKESGDGEWFLYLASDQINDSNFDLAYEDVHHLLGRWPRAWLDSFQVKVAGVGNPIVKDVIDIQQQYPAKFATRLRTRMLGGVFVADAYVYPIPVPALTAE